MKRCKNCDHKIIEHNRFNSCIHKTWDERQQVLMPCSCRKTNYNPYVKDKQKGTDEVKHG